MEISIVGGDRRSLYLKELLEKDKHKVELIGFSKYRRDTTTIDKPLNKFVVGGIPFVKEGLIHTPFGDEITLQNFKQKLTDKHILVAGGLSNIQLSCKSHDLLKNEEFLQCNALLTAEGTLQIVLSETPFSLSGSNVTIIGFGRIGSRLSSIFKHMGAKVVVVVNNQHEFNKATWSGFSVTHHQDINYVLKKSHVIINTPPRKLVSSSEDEETKNYVIGLDNFSAINRDSLVIDVSSKPYGVHENIKNIAKTMWIGNIPGKTAPQTGAFYIKKVVDDTIKLEMAML